MYTGYLTLLEEEIARFYNGNLTLETFPNEFIVVGNDIYKNNERLRYPTINNSWNNTIKPLDIYQRMAINILQNPQISVKIISGLQGSGKDYLMVNAALEALDKGRFDKILFIRPNVTLAHVPNIGYLPNGKEDKLDWTFSPLLDKVGGHEGLARLQEKGLIESEYLGFIRGASYDNTLVYMTEGQNIDTEMAKVLITRIGNNSELWINGDIDQIDSDYFRKNNGLELMIERLKEHPLFGYVYLPIIHRSEVAKMVELLR